MHSATALMAAVDVGGYVSILKLIPVLLILFAFTRVLTWIDKDAVIAHLPRESLNTGIFAAGMIAFALFFLLPNFWLSLAALIVVPSIGIGAYLGMRQKEVGLKDLKKEFNTYASGMVKREKKVTVKAGQVQLVGKGGAMLAPPADTDADGLRSTSRAPTSTGPVHHTCEPGAPCRAGTVSDGEVSNGTVSRGEHRARIGRWVA